MTTRSKFLNIKSIIRLIYFLLRSCCTSLRSYVFYLYFLAPLHRMVLMYQRAPVIFLMNLMWSKQDILEIMVQNDCCIAITYSNFCLEKQQAERQLLMRFGIFRTKTFLELSTVSIISCCSKYILVNDSLHRVR